jgi:hypothetical protein
MLKMKGFVTVKQPKPVRPISGPVHTLRSVRCTYFRVLLIINCIVIFVMKYCLILPLCCNKPLDIVSSIY